jgi:hypothetical protein
VPNFWRSVSTSVKVKSKKYFYFTEFLLKSTPCWLTSAKLPHWGHTNLFAHHLVYQLFLHFFSFS